MQMQYQYQIRRMEERDAAAAGALERVCFTDPWSEAAYQATLLLPYAHYYVAELPGRMERTGGAGPAGQLIPTEEAKQTPQPTEPECLQHAGAADPWEQTGSGEGTGKLIGVIGLELISGEGEISNVAVLPQFRQQGVAHALMETVLTDGRENGCSAFTLEVRESNTAARALYESFGFVTEGVRKNYYDTPTENALILWRRD